jgi:hypothetical protein
MKKGLLALCAALALTGCSDAEEEEPAGAIPQHQLEALEQAEAVEGMLQDAETRRREQMDDR